MGRIVVGVDGSTGSAAALQWAAHEGQARGWSVSAVLAWDLFAQHGSGPDQPRFDPHYGEADARAALDVYVETALGPGAALDDRKVVCDLPAPALLAESAAADLLVVGARGLGGFRGLLLGSVSEKCLQQASCPVVVIRAPKGALDEIERIVVGVDGSDAAARALGWALDEARAHHASIEAIHAWTLPVLAGDAFLAPALDPTAIEDEARRTLDELVHAADTSGLPEPVTRTVVNGGAAAAIVQAADSADLVIVGSRGRGGIKGLVLGSVSRQVAHHAPCPVLVVR